MNFATFSAVGSAATHYVTTGGQLPVTKIQQNNGNTLSQVVGMVGGVGEGVQYVRAIDSAVQPQLISVPISLPGQKPGDPQPTVQIQVLNPNMLQAQQPKYQMQIPIQGFSQGGAVLTLAYSPETNDVNGIQLVGQNTLSESGLQVMASLPQEMQLVQPAQTHNDDKSQIHQVFVTPNQQIIINSPVDNKNINNNTTSNNNNNTDIIIKEECDDSLMDDESSQGTETSESSPWHNSQQDLVKYLNSLAPQQTQTLPLSLQQFLKLNPARSAGAGGGGGAGGNIDIEVEVEEKKNENAVAEAFVEEDGTVRIQSKKKKKYKKKSPKPSAPKPGQIVITQTADGTPIYCCPECQMAYPVKEQLESHLVVHKIERRFICGICGAGLKRKEHLERHKLGHNPERPFVCGVCRKGFKRREHLNLHTVMHSGVKTETCNECGKGFYRKDHLRKHTRSHENKRAREEANADTAALFDNKTNATTTDNCATTSSTTNNNYSILPEITIHVPTSANVQVPVQINIPQHVVSSLAAAQQQQQQQQQNDTQAQLEALLAQHS